MGQSQPPFCLFWSFLHGSIQIYIDKSVDVFLGTQTQGGRMEGTDESTELWRHPTINLLTEDTNLMKKLIYRTMTSLIKALG